MAESTARATTLADFGKLMGRAFEKDEIAASIASYDPRPTDVVISPYGKCGTTWLQQIFHGLRTGGDMDFDDISRVVPWIETAKALGIDVNAGQRADPRGFKSHLSHDAVPKGARYLVSLRDPKDALISMYRFMEGWFIERGAIALDAFAMRWIGGSAESENYWKHLLSWWAVRDEPHVRLVSYAHMRERPEAHIRLIADFCGIDADEALIASTLERSSLAYMLDHKNRFDDAMMRRLTADRLGLPVESDSAKVRKGDSHGPESHAELGAMLDAIWRDRVTPETGFEDFAALESALRARNEAAMAGNRMSA